MRRELRGKNVTLALLWQETWTQALPDWTDTLSFEERLGLDKELVLSLAAGRWVRDHLNVLICGPDRRGESWIGCALAHSASRNGHSALYVRVSRPLSALATARADGRYPKLLDSLAKTEALVMDDWGLSPLHRGIVTTGSSSRTATGCARRSSPGLRPAVTRRSAHR